MAGSSNALDVNEPDQKYIQVSTVNVSNFVSVKLCGSSNYNIWRAQMLCLIKSQMLHHIIDANIPVPVGMDEHMTESYDNLVKGWIFGSMNETLLENFIRNETAIEVWTGLESSFSPQKNHGEGYSWNTRTEDLKYMQASNVNVACFVSVKLSGCSNYKIWKAQMICLIESQKLLHILGNHHPFPRDKGVHMILQYDRLVKGWIFGSMNENVLKDFIHLNSAGDVWMKLELSFDPPKSEDLKGLRFRRESDSIPEIEEMADIRLKKELYEAVVEGHWLKANSILKIQQNAATKAITEHGNTILHVAVEMGHNYFVEKLLDFLKDGKDIETKNDTGRTALHIAAIVGNTRAAQLLVQKRIELLTIQDNHEDSPLDIALSNNKLHICAYLLKATFSDLSLYSGYQQQTAIKAICVAISTRQYDLASALLERYHDVAKDNDDILLSITINFPTDLDFKESVIYPSFHNVRKKIVVRGYLLFNCNFLDKCVDDYLHAVKNCNDMSWSWLGQIFMIFLVPIATLYPIYELTCLLILILCFPFSMLYFLMWKVLAYIARPIKNIEKKRREYQEAKKILSLICNQMGTSNDGYSEPILEAVRKGAYEVVDEILFTSSSAINCKDEEGHNIIQLAIIYRSEKIYNLIHYIIEGM